MSDGIDELRVDLARERGLPDAAVSFLRGGTVAEVEAEADTLAALLGTTRVAREPECGPAQNPFTIAVAQKQQRKRELLATFSGRHPQQPRDARGRFATFDGGARQSVPAPRDPEADHNELVNRVATVARMFARSEF
jgi:hypothetical protein